jgi:hypothetical protein
MGSFLMMLACLFNVCFVLYFVAGKLLLRLHATRD